MTEPTYTVTIDRESLDLTELLFHEHYGPGWGILPGLQMPGLEPQVQFADSTHFHGDEPWEWRWVNGILSFDVEGKFDDVAALMAAVAEVRDALGRLTFPITTTWNGHAQVWRGLAGGRFAPSELTYVEVRDSTAVYSLSVPVYPIPGSP